MATFLSHCQIWSELRIWPDRALRRHQGNLIPLHTSTTEGKVSSTARCIHVPAIWCITCTSPSTQTEQVLQCLRVAATYLLLVTVFSVVILLFLLLLVIPVVLRVAAGITAGVISFEAVAERRLLRRAQQLRRQRRQQVAGAHGLLAAVCAPHGEGALKAFSTKQVSVD